MRGVLFVGSVGLALHLVLPQLPGLERSLWLVAGTSHPLVGAAFLAEVLSELCYAELLRRSVGDIFTAGSSPSFRRLGRWFMLRLTVTGYGAAHVLPGGGATAAAVTYGALRRKGYNPQSVGLALAAVSVLVYGALGMLFSGSVIYMLLDRDLGPVSTAASIFFLALTLSVTTVAYAAYRRPTFAKNVAKKGARLTGRLLGGEGLRRRAWTWSARFISRLGEEIRATRGAAGRTSHRGTEARCAGTGLLGLRRPVPHPHVRRPWRGGRSPHSPRGLLRGHHHRGDTTHAGGHRHLRGNHARYTRPVRGWFRGRDTDPRVPALQLLATHTARRRFLPDTPMQRTRPRSRRLVASDNRWRLRTRAEYGKVRRSQKVAHSSLP